MEQADRKIFLDSPVVELDDLDIEVSCKNPRPIFAYQSGRGETAER